MTVRVTVFVLSVGCSYVICVHQDLFVHILLQYYKKVIKSSITSGGEVRPCIAGGFGISLS